MFNCADMQITHFVLDKILKLLIYYTPFYRLVVAKLFHLKKQSGFLAYLVV